MSESTVELQRERVAIRPTIAVAGAYAALGIALFWSRLFDLDQSFWFDESYFVTHYVRAGPRTIIAGSGLSHELYGLLAWATGQVVGESELAYRLLSAVPFVIGVVFVTAWLHRRLNPLSGLLYLFLATVSPLLLDITRQARGYGLAFLAMSVVVVAALEANRTERALYVAVMCIAGVVGAWTLPQFAIAFGPMCLVLVASRRLRWSALVGLLVSASLIYAWYAPHAGKVQASSQIPEGLRISAQWLVTAPLDFTVIPALVWIDGTAAVPGFVWLPFVVLALVVMASSPLARQPRPALILCSGVVVLLTFLWIGRAYVVPRYLSFLLVPLFVLLASGASSILGRIRTRPQLGRTVACLVVVAVLAARFVSLAPDVVGRPREAYRSAADVIERTPPTTPVYSRLHTPQGLVFYLGRPVRELTEPTAAARVCRSRVTVAYVMQPFLLPPVTIPCLTRHGVRAYRFAQYARGNEMDVWLVPPTSARRP